MTRIVQTTRSMEQSGLHRKSAIGASNDPLELEADEVASQVRGLPRNAGYQKLCPSFSVVERQEKPPLALVPQPQVSEAKDLSLYPYVDDFTAVYYDVDYRHQGGNLSKWLRAEILTA